LFVTRRDLVGIASHDDDTKVFDQCICCDGSHRQTSFIAGVEKNRKLGCATDRQIGVFRILKQAKPPAQEKRGE
jgi:hypothetical protein